MSTGSRRSTSTSCTTRPKQKPAAGTWPWSSGTIPSTTASWSGRRTADRGGRPVKGWRGGYRRPGKEIAMADDTRNMEQLTALVYKVSKEYDERSHPPPSDARAILVLT